MTQGVPLGFYPQQMPQPPDPRADGDEIYYVVGAGAAVFTGLLAWLWKSNSAAHEDLDDRIDDVNDRVQGFDGRLLDFEQRNTFEHALIAAQVQAQANMLLAMSAEPVSEPYASEPYAASVMPTLSRRLSAPAALSQVMPTVRQSPMFVPATQAPRQTLAYGALPPTMAAPQMSAVPMYSNRSFPMSQLGQYGGSQLGALSATLPYLATQQSPQSQHPVSVYVMSQPGGSYAPAPTLASGATSATTASASGTRLPSHLERAITKAMTAASVR